MSNQTKTTALDRQETSLTDKMLESINEAVGQPVDGRRIVEILVQRRLLSINMFTWMLDNLICAMDDDEAREIAIGILREEYAGPNHRYEFLMEIVDLGLTRRDVLRRKPSKVTEDVMRGIARLTVELIEASDLERLTFLRFFAEILPGHEFAHLLDIMVEHEMIVANDSRFLRPHVNYDVVGNKEALSHAEQYRAQIEQLIEKGGDRKAVTKILRRSCDLRLRFYSQFAGTN